MSLFQFIALFSAGSSLIIGIFAYFSRPERGLNQTFLLLTCLIGAWQFNVFMGMSSQESGYLTFWIRQANGISAFIPAMMNLTRVAILYPNSHLPGLLKRNLKWILLSLLMYIMCQSTLFLVDATPPVEGELLPTVHYGPAFPVLGIYFLLSFGRLFYLLFKSNRELRGSGKAEIEYLLLSCGTSLFLGVFVFLVSNVTQWKDLGALLPLSVLVFSAITGYGVATKGILDVSVLLRRIISYSMLVIYLSLLYWISHTLLSFCVTIMGYDPAPVANLFSALIVAFSVTPAHGFAQSLANKLFILSTPLNVGGILSDASRSLNTVLTLDELFSRFHSILEKNLETSDLRIFVKENDVYTQVYPAGTYRKIPITAPIPGYLSDHESFCVQELLDRGRMTPDVLKMSEELKNENLAGAIGFHRNRKMAGFLLVGTRSSGRLFAQEETMVIEGLRDLFAVSFENAQLYTEVQNGRIYMDLLLNNLVNGVVATDNSGCITTCNPEAFRILDCREGELIGKHIKRLPKPLYDVLNRVLEKGSIIRDKEIQLSADEENPLHLYAGASLFRNLKGEVLGSLLVLQDRTAIRNLEEQVKRSERLASLGTLSAGMAHEIKNPLVTLQTFTQLLPERFHDAEYRETFVDLAGKEISRIDGLVNKLLTLARPVKLDLKELSLNHLLERYAKIFSEQAEEAGITLIETYQATSDRMVGDADQLRQVLLNLLLNAQQAMPGGGEIHLHTRDTEGYVEMEIRDTGEGISPENQSHVFDPFFTTKSTGTGLGLAVAHQILQEHRAIVRVESEPGKGCAFIIQFRLATVEEEE